MGIQSQPHMTGQDLILLLTKLRIDLPGRAPHGRAMFLAIPRPAAFRVIDAQAHNVNAGTNQDGQQALVRPLDLEWMLQRGGQVGEQIRQTAAKGLCNEQRRPDDRDVKEKAKNIVVLICLLQAVHLHTQSKTRRAFENAPRALLNIMCYQWFSVQFIQKPPPPTFLSSRGFPQSGQLPYIPHFGVPELSNISS